MTSRPPPPDRISADLIEEICRRVSRNQRVRRLLPEGGHIHMERRLPFLCLYRRPSDHPDPGTGSLITGQSAHLAAPGAPQHVPALRELLSRLTAELGEAFDAFLLVEIWAAAERCPEEPDFTIVAAYGKEFPETAEKLADALRQIHTPRGPATAEIRKGSTPGPPALPGLLPQEHLKKFAVLSLGLEIQPYFRDPETGTPFPEPLRELQRDLSAALQRALYEFIRLETRKRPPHYHVLGRGSVLRAVWEADRTLTEVTETFDFLLAVTPYNVREAWESFRRSGFEKPPPFRYRLLSFDPATLKRKLHNIMVDPLEDPAITDLLRKKRSELEIQLTMLENRRTPRFLYGSLQLHGGIEESLRELANRVMEETVSAGGEADDTEAGGEAIDTEPGKEGIDAEGFARLARAEVAEYRKVTPELNPTIEIRGDISSLLVSKGNLLIAADTRIQPSRARALIQHEVGTHMLTYFNGGRQRLTVLKSGLPGSDELQEGLAVLAEYLVGSLGHRRLRLLAARVLASDQCAKGAAFVDTFRLLHREHGFSAHTAFQVAMRVHRGGGFVKDQVYLKGLARLLRYLATDGALRPLYVGKIGLDHVKAVEELLWRGVLQPPSLKPRYLTMRGARRKLETLRRGISVLDLLSKEAEWRSVSS